MHSCSDGACARTRILEAASQDQADKGSLPGIHRQASRPVFEKPCWRSVSGGREGVEHASRGSGVASPCCPRRATAAPRRATCRRGQDGGPVWSGLEGASEQSGSTATPRAFEKARLTGTWGHSRGHLTSTSDRHLCTLPPQRL